MDALDGVFDNVHIYGLNEGLNARAVLDYNSDVLRLEISNNGSQQLSFDTNGDAGVRGDAASSLWDALTAGQGTFDEGAPMLEVEDGEIAELVA